MRKVMGKANVHRKKILTIIENAILREKKSMNHKLRHKRNIVKVKNRLRLLANEQICKIWYEGANKLDIKRKLWLEVGLWR